MHFVVCNIIHFYRAECAEPHMECDIFNSNSLLLNLGEQFFCKVQSGSRCGRRAFVL